MSWPWQIRTVGAVSSGHFGASSNGFGSLGHGYRYFNPVGAAVAGPWPGQASSNAAIPAEENTPPAIQVVGPVVEQTIEIRVALSRLRRLWIVVFSKADWLHLSGNVTQVAPYVLSKASWKRCASHVYIAHFIDYQQQISRHPYFNPAYQNYAPKPYNLNIPLAPTESIFGSGPAGAAGSVCGPAGSGSSTGPSGLTGGPMGDRNHSATAMAAVNASDRGSAAYVDAASRKQPAQQQPSGSQQPLKVSSS